MEVLGKLGYGLILTDEAGQLRSWNQEAGRLAGLASPRDLHRSFWEIFGESKPGKIHQEYLQMLQSQAPVQFEDFFPKQDAWLEINLSPVQEGLAMCFRDITERKKNQEQIQLHEQTLAQIFSNVEDVIYLYQVETTPEGRKYRFEVINDSFLKATGLREEDVAGRYVDEVIPEPSLSLVLAKYEKAIQTGKTVRWEEVTPYPAGLKTGLVAITPIYDEHQICIKLVGSVHDITQIRLAEKKLMISNERYKYATEAANDAIYDWNILTGDINWGTGFKKLFGFNGAYRKSSLPFWADHIAPEEREAILQSLQEGLQNSEQKKWRQEYRFRRIDGSYAYVIDQGYFIWDKDRAVRMVGAMQDISERKKAEEELRKLSLIAEKTVNGIIITDAAGCITWTNEAFTRISGYALEEISGKKPGSFLQGRETAPETIQYMHNQVERALPFDCEILNYSKAGSRFWIKIQGQPIFNKEGELESFFSIQTDITRQKEEEIKLRLLESSITNATDSIIIVEPISRKNKNLRIIFTNAAFTRMTGYKNEDVIGFPPEILLGPESNLKDANRFSRALRDFQPYESELLLYKKSGEPFWSLLSTFPISDKQGKLTHCNIIQRDISARKARELEREQMLAQLTRTNEDLKQFSFITSHNLNAPISNLIGLLNLVNREAITDPANLVILDKFKESTLKLNAIIQDLTEVLVVKNPWQAQNEWLDLAPVFEEVVKSVDHLLNEAEAIIHTDFSKGEKVYYSAEYLRSIFINLLTNAIKYRSPNRKLVIEVRTEVQDQFLYLYFSDNGSGIDLRRYGHKIFGLYQRFHKSHDSKGLGLFMIRSQIKAMGGNITVASEVDQGTLFTIQFKLPETALNPAARPFPPQNP
ncbi:MAG: PAS domain S-box protein [Adhaeribacter sp.]